MKTKTFFTGLLALATSLVPAFAGGTLTPVGSPHAPIQIRSHQVNVTINKGFAQTEVLQTFFNPNPTNLEAVYAFPVPKSASLSEVTITSGEKTLNGEVLPKQDAEKIYQEEKAQGNDAGLTTKNGFQNYEFRIANVRAQAETQLRFLYYQPLEIDTGVGRYVYPLEEGGTDEVAKGFWQPANSTVSGNHQSTWSSSLPGPWPMCVCRVLKTPPSRRSSIAATTNSRWIAPAPNSIATSCSTTASPTISPAASK